MNENNEFVIFEEYVNYVCKKIMSRRKKNEVRDELYSHLLEEYDRNIALGLDNLSAQEKAVQKMGDKEKTTNEFGRLYSIIPTEYMRSSLNFIIWGMVLSFFQINLFPGMSEITKFIGSLLFLFGLFKLRNTSKKFNVALFLNIGVEIFSLIVQNVSLYSVDSSKIQLINIFIAMPLNLAIYWCVFTGIKDITKNLVSDNDKQPHLIGGFISYIICGTIIVFSALTETAEFALITPILMIFSLCQLGRAKNILAYKEPEFDLTEALKKSEKAFYIVLAITLAITPLISTYIASAPKVETEIFNAEDTSADKIEIENARINMIELGFPEEYLIDLPDSEVLKYVDATYMLTEKPVEVKTTTLANDKEVISLSETFHFFYPDGEVRTMMRVELPEGSKAKYRNGLYHQYYDGDFVSLNLNEKDDFFIALSESEGTTYSASPLSEYTPKNQFDKLYITGYEFAFTKGSTNRRAYLSNSAIIKNNNSRIVATDAVFFWQKYPIGITGSSINEMALKEFDGVFSFGGSSFEPIKRFDLYNSFDYHPDFKIKNNSTDDENNKK